MIKKSSKTYQAEQCGYCKKDTTSSCITHMTQLDGSSKVICDECHIKMGAERFGISPPSRSEFPPITLFDAIGKKHTFYFHVMLTTGLGIQAFELIDGSRGGYQFSVLDHPETDINELYGRLVKKIEAGIAERYLHAETFEPFNTADSKVYIRGSAVNGIISTQDGEPTVIIDGKEMSWQELGESLSSHEGFGFRLECFDLTDDVEIAADPKKPDPLWWLEMPTVQEKVEKTFQ